MQDLDAIKRAILLDPSDDVARLAYADALEETGRQDHVRKAKLIRDGLRFRGMAYHTSEAWMFVKKVSALEYLRKPLPSTSDIRPISVELTVSRGLPFKWQCPLEDFMDGAAMLFSTHPIAEVVLKDKKPEWSADTPPCWACYPGDHFATAHSEPYLPEEIFRLLSPRAYNGTNHCVYESDGEALRDLSSACVTYGRSLAGLPPLPV